MNEQDFLGLVERAGVEVKPSPAPVEEVIRAVRRRRRLPKAGAVIGIAAAVALVVVSGVTLGEQRHPGPAAGSNAATPSVPVVPEGKRLVGESGFVVAVPQGWGTDQVGCDGWTPVRPTVVFGHGESGMNLCGVRLKDPVPWVRISGDLDDPLRLALGSGTLAGEVGGMAVRHGPYATDRFGAVTSWVSIPQVPLRITAAGPTKAAVDEILDSVHQAPAGSTLVPNWRVPGPRDLPRDQMTGLVRAAGFVPVVVEREGGWQGPGAFLRTVPPIGTPLTPGDRVTVVYSAGNLGYYATPKSLASKGWRVSPAWDFDTVISRARARKLAGAPEDADVFLRAMDWAPCTTSCDHQISKLAWLVVQSVHYNGHGNTSRLVAIDARSGLRLPPETFSGTS